MQPLMLTPDQDVHASRQMLAMASLSISSSCLIWNPVRVNSADRLQGQLGLQSVILVFLIWG